MHGPMSDVLMLNENISKISIASATRLDPYFVNGCRNIVRVKTNSSNAIKWDELLLKSVNPTIKGPFNSESSHAKSVERRFNFQSIRVETVLNRDESQEENFGADRVSARALDFLTIKYDISLLTGEIQGPDDKNGERTIQTESGLLSHENTVQNASVNLTSAAALLELVGYLPIDIANAQMVNVDDPQSIFFLITDDIYRKFANSVVTGTMQTLDSILTARFGQKGTGYNWAVLPSYYTDAVGTGIMVFARDYCTLYQGEPPQVIASGTNVEKGYNFTRFGFDTAAINVMQKGAFVYQPVTL